MRDRVLDALFGGVIGGLTGAVVALNILAFSGMEQGYATSVLEAFRENRLVGLVVVLALVAGPIAGVVVALRMNRTAPSVSGATERELPGRGGDE